MSAADATAGAARTHPGLFSRIVGVLLSPRETFAAVAARPQWVGVMAITLVLASACQYLIISSPALQDAIIDQQIQRMESGGNSVSDEQIAGVERFIMRLPVIYAVGTLILGPLFAAAVAGIFFGIFTTLMGGAGTFRQVYAVLAHAGIVSVLGGLLSAALMLAGAEPSGVSPPGANLGVFVPMLEETSFVARLLGAIDLVLVWWLVTLSIGLAVLYKRKTGPIAMSLIAVYFVIALVIAFVRSGS